MNTQNHFIPLITITGDHTKAKHTFCLILTREGRAYSEEGKQYVTDMLTKEFGVEGVCLFEGRNFNSKKLLRVFLESNPDTYIVVSTAENIIFIPPENNGKVIKALSEEDSDRTSWEVIKELCDRHANR